MNKAIFKVLTGSALLAMAATAQAREVDESIDAASDGHVEIINISGSVEVYGWSNDTVEVKGELGSKVEELILERNGDKVLVKVKVPRNNSNNISSDLVVRIPEDSSVEVSTVSADITSEDVEGEQNLKTVSGDVYAQAANSDISAQAVSGDVNVDGNGAEIETQATTVSGDVEINNVSGEVGAEAVSGEVIVRDGSFKRANLNTVNGEIVFHAELRDEGKLSVETVNGDVDIQFAGGVSARFDIETFNGDIDNCFGPEPKRTSKYTPGWSLRFQEGDGDARVTASTVNGDISVCR